MEIYGATDVIPLSFSRVRGGVLVTGLTVSVTVTNARTGVVLLPPAGVPEVPVGSGIYQLPWAHGLSQDTQCAVTYTVNVQKFLEYIYITNDLPGGRSV